MKKKKLKYLLIVIIIVFLAFSTYWLLFFNIIPQKSYKAADFGITIVKSKIDHNKNGIDDYTDILLGARKDGQNHPKYKSVYYAGGYPPDNEGVCTDLVWRAFKNAGYSLKDMVDEDIAQNIKAYPAVNGRPDTNIDFRRVPNLKVFFERDAISLTLDPDDIKEWQPGDIVTYGTSHIAIVSDKRDKNGIAYIIHNAGQPIREENALTRQKISGHFRFGKIK